MKRLLVGCITLGLLAALTTMAAAQPKTDSFFAELEGANQLTTGGGSGWNAGEWIYYDQTIPEWWNQWFYDDPPRQDRWKEISYDIFVDPMPIELVPGAPPWAVPVGNIEVALNWSTMDYPETGPGGQPPMPWEEPVIDRYVIYSGPNDASTQVIGGYDIPDFNPEWVSIDVWVDSFAFWEEEVFPGEWEQFMAPLPVMIDGTITHECIPEPSTAVLLAMGVVGLAFAWRRRRN